MKRYRVISFDFDSRTIVFEPVQDHWEDKGKEQHLGNQKDMLEDLKAQYGEVNIETKIHNFIDLKLKPFSVLAFHNKFLEQIRNAYITESYYPALTGACALGERILNHMLRLLRQYHKDTAEYKKVHSKDSFDNWQLAIDTLASWGELFPDAIPKFYELEKKRVSDHIPLKALMSDHFPLDIVPPSDGRYLYHNPLAQGESGS